MRFLKENWKLECILFNIQEIWTGKYVIRSCFPLSFNKETSSTKFLLMTLKWRSCIFYQKFLLSNVSMFFVFLFFILNIFKFLPFIALFFFTFSLSLCYPFYISFPALLIFQWSFVFLLVSFWVLLSFKFVELLSIMAEFCLYCIIAMSILRQNLCQCMFQCMSETQ
jgi:hypothetical protein